MKECNAAYKNIEQDVKGVRGVVSVQMMMCSTCCDYKILITQGADHYPEWKAAGHAPEEAFLESLKAIEGVNEATSQLYSIHNMEDWETYQPASQ